MANYRKTPNSQQIPVQVVGSSIFGIFEKINAEKTYNMFESDRWLINFAGYERFLQLFATGSGRGIYHCIRGNFLIVVVNAQVVKIDSNFNVVNVGTTATSSGEVFIDENLNAQICIVDGVNAYIYNYNNSTFTTQTLTAGLQPGYVQFHNTFFLFGNNNTSGDGAAWYAYQYATPTTISLVTPSSLALQTKPDYARAVRRLPGQGNNVIVFGQTVCEIWTQVGGVQNYRRNSTISIDYGCASVSTIDASDQYIAWLGINESNAPSIMMYSPDGLRRISTDGIDYVLQNINVPSDSTAFFFRQSGHLFYVLTFFNETDNVSFAYDVNTDKFFFLTDEDLNYFPARDVVYFNNSWYFISLNNGSLYKLAPEITFYDENLVGASVYDDGLVYDIPRIRICNTIRAEDSAPFRVNSFVMTLQQGCDPYYIAPAQELPIITEGAGLNVVTEGSAPVNIVMEGSGMSASLSPAPMNYAPRIDCSVSRDGGITWSNDVSRTLNPQGYRKNILNWENMGAANDFTIKLRFWGLGSFVVNNGFVDIC